MDTPVSVGDAVDAFRKWHCLTTPSKGSPNTVLVHGVPSANVR